MTKQFILASQSPRRKQLLEWAEINFEVMVSDTDESYPPGLAMEEVAIFIAKNKALAVSNTLHTMGNRADKVIIAADTIVVLQNEIIGKPANREDAMAILTKLSGKKHCVVTGVAIETDTQQIAFADITEVEFHLLTNEQISFYVDKYQPYDKAGAYAIQEWIGVIGIKSIRGDFYNVMGLPISRVVQHLKML